MLYKVFSHKIDKHLVENYCHTWGLNVDEFTASIQYFMHTIWCISNSRDYTYVRLHHKVLKSKYGNRKYRYVKRFLIKQGYIEESSYYNPGVQCKGYRLTNKAKNNSIGWKTVSGKYWEKLIQTQGNIDNNSSTEIEKRLKKLSKRVLKNSRFKKEYWVVSLYVALSQSKSPQEVERKLKSYQIALYRLQNGELYTAYDGRRLYSNHTNIKSELLPLLLIDNKTTYEVDIKNSQFSFLAKLLNEEYGLSENDPFYKDVMSGNIYDKMGQYFNQDRKWAKHNLIVSLYINNRKQNKYTKLSNDEIYNGKIVDKYLTDKYPIAYKLIKTIKLKIGNKRFAKLIQQIEAKTVLGIQDEYNKFNILTKHDSFISDDKNLIKSINNKLNSLGFKTEINNNKDKSFKLIKESKSIISKLLNNQWNKSRELVIMYKLLSGADQNIINEFLENIHLKIPEKEKSIKICEYDGRKYSSIF